MKLRKNLIKLIFFIQFFIISANIEEFDSVEKDVTCRIF